MINNKPNKIEAIQDREISKYTKSSSQDSKTDYFGSFSEQNYKNLTMQQFLKNSIKYKRYKFFDCCNGKFAAKYNIGKILESVYYVPVWLICTIIFTNIGLISSIIYLTVDYTNNLQLLNYGSTCGNNSQCNINKGLYCRTSNSTSLDYCNCPAKSSANMCDCPNSFFWNGLTCTSVLSYGNGPCIGDYSCQSGLICNPYTATCTCPDLTSLWNEITKTCTYNYKGCYNSCLYTNSCDFYQNDIILTGYSNGFYTIELDDCLNLCNLNNFKYVHMQFSNSTYKCACSNSYNKLSVQVSDSECNIPCSLIKSSVSKCPKNLRHSSFQIGL